MLTIRLPKKNVSSRPKKKEIKKNKIKKKRIHLQQKLYEQYLFAVV